VQLSVCYISRGTYGLLWSQLTPLISNLVGFGIVIALLPQIYTFNFFVPNGKCKKHFTIVIYGRSKIG